MRAQLHFIYRAFALSSEIVHVVDYLVESYRVDPRRDGAVLYFVGEEEGQLKLAVGDASLHIERIQGFFLWITLRAENVP
jgi:hypothetical protein